jgi:predicted lipid-binding transport protein (Tim44 family)
LLKRNSKFPKNEARPVKQNLDILEGKDKKEFLRGAEIAYESILTSFASGDLIKLKNLLSANMFSNFSEAIKSRNKEGIKSEFTFHWCKRVVCRKIRQN